MRGPPRRFTGSPRTSLPGKRRRHSPRYSYTSQGTCQAIFLSYCFKHVTGRIVSQDGPQKTKRGALLGPGTFVPSNAIAISARTKSLRGASISHFVGRQRNWTAHLRE